MVARYADRQMEEVRREAVRVLQGPGIAATNEQLASLRSLADRLRSGNQDTGNPN
jgi:hypothetical protein